MNEISTDEAWEQCLSRSQEQPVLVFKHSTRCGISSSAYNRVQAYLEEQSEPPETFLVKVVEHRPVSNRVAADMGVVHASPQMILVHQGSAVWNASHHGINADSIETALAALCD